MPSGQLPANKWTKVISGWGWYAVHYGISTGLPRASGPYISPMRGPFSTSADGVRGRDY
jgi:hypothetical protein